MEAGADAFLTGDAALAQCPGMTPTSIARCIASIAQLGAPVARALLGLEWADDAERPDCDKDGVFDDEDACPDVAGVRTGDPTTNGCPASPPDHDGDGIIDSEDACPDVPGIKTADPTTNGCPDTDRDKDGILNDVDACPDEAAPKSVDPKTTGCPRVFIKAGLIQILEQPKFDFNKANIKPDSDSLLTEVAKVMSDHPEIWSGARPPTGVAP